MSAPQDGQEAPRPYGVSPSRVNQIETCPRQYWYSTVLRMPEARRPATYRGTAFHALMERMFLQTAEDPSTRTLDFTIALLREMFRTELVTAEIAAEMGLDEVGVQAFARDLVKLTRNYFEMEDPAEIVAEGVELEIAVDMGGFTLKGILDRLDRNPDGSLQIVDYKTGKVPQDRYKAQALLPSRIYAYLAERHLGERPFSIRLMYVQHMRELVVNVDDAAVEMAERRVREAWAKIEGWLDAGYFPPVANNLCANWCAFRDVCPLFATPEYTPF